MEMLTHNKKLKRVPMSAPKLTITEPIGALEPSKISCRNTAALALTIVRDGVRMSYEVRGIPESMETRIAIFLRELVALVTISIGALLAIVRPNRASLGFFHYVVGGDIYPNALTSIWLDYPWRMYADGINDLLVSGAVIGLLMFSLGFPRDLLHAFRGFA